MTYQRGAGVFESAHHSNVVTPNETRALFAERVVGMVVGIGDLPVGHPHHPGPAPPNLGNRPLEHRTVHPITNVTRWVGRDDRPVREYQTLGAPVRSPG